MATMEDHITEQALEMFARSLLDGEDLRLLEEHILACDICTGRLIIIDDLIAALRAYLTNAELEQQSSKPQTAAKSSGKLLLFKTRSNASG